MASKKHPFGGNPFGAPSLPFDIKPEDPFKDAENFDFALGLKDKRSDFSIVSDIDAFGSVPEGRKKRKSMRNFSIERQQRILSGEAPLSPEELSNKKANRDFFGAPLTE